MYGVGVRYACVLVLNYYVRDMVPGVNGLPIEICADNVNTKLANGTTGGLCVNIYMHGDTWDLR